MKYKSKYDGTQVTAARYISELVCGYNAAQHQSELPRKFWTLPLWKQFYMIQTQEAAELLEKYSEDHVIQFVKDKRIFNLRAQWIKTAIKQFKPTKRNVTGTVCSEPVKPAESFATKQDIALDQFDG